VDFDYFGQKCLHVACIYEFHGHGIPRNSNFSTLGQRLVLQNFEMGHLQFKYFKILKSRGKKFIGYPEMSKFTKVFSCPCP
jgi:hypothetical protein